MPSQSNLRPSASYQQNTPWLVPEQQLFTVRHSLVNVLVTRWVLPPDEPELDPPELELLELPVLVPELVGASSPELSRQPADVHVEPLSQ